MWTDCVYLITREQGKFRLFRELAEDEIVHMDQEVMREGKGNKERWLYLFEAEDYRPLEECITQYRKIILGMNKILEVAGGAGSGRAEKA